MKMYLGIDGGGTRTRMALVGEEGRLHGLATGGSCSFADRGLEQAGVELKRLWSETWKIAGAQPGPADAVFMGMGSVLAPAEARVNCDLAVQAGLALPGRIHAGNDAWNAHAGTFFGRPGILLISGTGSACLGRNAAGDSWRAGGWGHRLGEAGSAYAIGEAAMVAATRAADGRGRPTVLTDLVCAAFGLCDLKEIYGKIHYDGVSRTAIAALAPQVVMLAETGDGVARQILIQAVAGLAEMVATVAARLRLVEPEIGLTGGLVTNALGFRRLLLDDLASAVSGFRLAPPQLPPVFGAVLIAFEKQQGTPPPLEFLTNLQRSAAGLAPSL